MVKPNMNWLELDITYVCGMNCHNCNRMTGIAPGRPEQNIAVAQIEALIADSIRLRYVKFATMDIKRDFDTLASKLGWKPEKLGEKLLLDFMETVQQKSYRCEETDTTDEV